MNNLVLFDFDGTLADTAPDLAAAANKLRSQRGLAELEYTKLRPFASHGARGLIKAALGVNTDDAAYEDLKNQFLDFYAADMVSNTSLFDGIDALLNNLEQHNIKWGIVTNKVEKLALPIIRHLGLENRSCVNVGGDTTAHPKPHPEPLFYASQHANIDAHHSIYIGDDERDIIAGKAAGMATAVAAYGYCYLDDPTTWSADFIANQPGELWPIVQKWLQISGN